MTSASVRRSMDGTKPTLWRVDPNTLRSMRVGNILMIAGASLLVIGALVRFAPGLFSWFGHLPGDIDIQGENSRVVIPITSMIVVSVALTVIVNVVGMFLRDR